MGHQAPIPASGSASPRRRWQAGPRRRVVARQPARRRHLMNQRDQPVSRRNDQPVALRRHSGSRKRRMPPTSAQRRPGQQAQPIARTRRQRRPLPAPNLRPASVNRRPVPAGHAPGPWLSKQRIAHGSGTFADEDRAGPNSRRQTSRSPRTPAARSSLLRWKVNDRARAQVLP